MTAKKRILLCTSALVSCLAAAPASAQQAISTPIFTSEASDENFRDLAGIAATYGGTGFADPTSNNGWLRTGVFYRSEALSTGSLSAADLATLTSLHIGLDMDLRTPSEINGQASIPLAPNAGPDQSIGATWVNVNIYGTPSPQPPDVSSATAAYNFMVASYQGFANPANQTEIAAIRTALLTLANTEGTALYHCSGGKDRTGWISMLLQTIAGVPSATIMQDYLATNQYMANSIAWTLNQISDPALKPGVQVMLGVQEDFLTAGIREMKSKYGSMYAYLTSPQGLGLSLADIYVLRAKMVYYPMLPGQSGMVGNAAAGAAFLNALQNSPLSGRYTDYNYYLQSAIDAGTLGGVETQAGGQVHADAAAQLLRQPLWLDGAIAPYAGGRDLGVGQTRAWLAGGGGYFSSDGHDGIAGSSERTAGSVIGTTYRIDTHASVHVGVGYNWGSAGSAGATADMDTGLATVGGRYGLSSLEAGPYAAARANAGYVDYRSTRALGGGLDTARGHTSGVVYGARADIGDVIRWAPFTITPQIGLRVTRVDLGGFDESGSDLALAVERVRHTSSTVVADLDVSLDPQRLSDWTLAPSVVLGYERALDDPAVDSTGTLYGFTVTQYSAYDSRYLVKAGFAFTAQRDAWTVKAGVNALRGEQASTGISAQVMIGRRF